MPSRRRAAGRPRGARVATLAAGLALAVGVGTGARCAGVDRGRAASSASPTNRASAEVAAGRPRRAHLLGWSWSGYDGPAAFAARAAHVDTLPFDGAILLDTIGRHFGDVNVATLSGLRDVDGAWSFAAADANWRPLRLARFRRPRHDMARVYLGLTTAPPGLRDDAGWAVLTRGASQYARALAANGVRGVVVDNEMYHDAEAWRYDARLPRWAGAPHRAWVAAARQRGRELATALRAGGPALVLLVTHGPYVGCGASRAEVGGYPDDRFLEGAFAAGMIEAGSPAQPVVDGGELYAYRTPDEFARSAAWRRDGMARRWGGCPFLDSALAGGWRDRVRIGFGVYDRERVDGEWRTMTRPAGYAATLTHALRAADAYAWAYAQGRDWWRAPGDTGVIPAADAQWIAAVRAARAAAADP